MKKLFTSIFILLFYSVTIYAQTATAPSGSGISTDPYLIATLDNLYWITQNSSEWGKYFKQTADIDASSTNSWDSGAGFTPIGNNSKSFSGTYNGNMHTISNLHINRSSDEYVGLFGYAVTSDIKNIGLININVNAGGFVGAIAGRTNSSTITNCYSTGSVTGINYYIGGLVGDSDLSDINTSYSTCTVSGQNQFAGGLVGANNTSNIYNSYATGSVTGIIKVGGLAGANYGGTINNSYSTGSVTGSGVFGGLIGTISGSTTNNSFWDTQTSGQSTSAGGTGKTTAEMKTLSTYLNASWDFEVETTNGTNNYWDIDNANRSVNNGYPFLSWQNGASVSVSTSVPTVSIASPGLSLTNTGPVTYAITYDGAATVNLTSSKITLNKTGTANGTVAVSNGTTINPTVTISGITGDGTLGISIQSGTSSSINGTNDTGAGSSATFTVDNTGPAVNISAPSASSTKNGTVTYSITYSDASSINLTNSDVTLNKTGTADGTVAVSNGTTSNPTVTISNIGGDGTLSITLAAATSSDNLGNSDTGAGPSTIVTVDSRIPDGSGISTDPYLIANLGNLQWVSENPSSWGSYFKQTADIDASSTSSWDSGAGFSPIGSGSNFGGTYDGDGHTIDNIYINRPSSGSIGVFGTAKGILKNLGVTNVNITGGTQYTGGLAGLGGTVSNCYSTGAVEGDGLYVGGLIGILHGSGATLSSSYSTATVTSGAGTYYAGGLLGSNNLGKVSNCYSTGSVIGGSGTNYVGGLLGSNGGEVSNCYSIGSVTGSASPLFSGGLLGVNSGGTMTSIFWNTDVIATGIGFNSGTGSAYGKTTAEMKDPATFLNAGWDFEVETNNGTDNYWDMDNVNETINSGYPFLSWENGTAVAISVPTPTVSIGAPSSTISNTGPVTFSITYSNAETVNLTSGDITLNKTGTANGTIGVTNGTTNNPTVTLSSITGDGTLGISIASGTSSNILGQKDIGAGPSTTFTVDNIAPTVVTSSTKTSPTNASSIDLTVTFSEEVSGFSSGDVVLSTGSLSNFATSDNITFTANITGMTDGTVTADINATVANDLAGNGNTAATQFSIVYDGTPPPAPSMPDLADASDSGRSSSDNDTNNTTPTFSGTAEANSTVTIISSLDGTLGTTTADGSGDWSFTVGSALTEGNHNITATASDAAGNTSSSSSALALTIDVTAPAAPSTPDLADASDTGSSNTDNVTNDDTPTLNGTAEANSTVSVTSSVDGTLGTTTADGSGNWSFTPAAPISSGDHNLTATATDAAGNTSSVSSGLTITLDTNPPTVLITSIADGYINGSFVVTFTLSKPVQSFLAHNVSVKNGTVTKFSGSGLSYQATITPAFNGEVGVEVNANQLQDGSGNNNLQSNYFQILYDTTQPSVSIHTDVLDYTNSSFTLTIVFNEVVHYFGPSKINVQNAVLDNFTSISDGSKYTVEVIPQSVGIVTLQIPEGEAFDIALNGNTASNLISVNYDNTPIIPVITSSLKTIDKTNAVFKAFFTFNKPVTGFELADIGIVNGTASDFEAIDETSYSALITPAEDGEVTVYLEAGVASDVYGNMNLASDPYTITYNATPPEIICPDTVRINENSTEITTVTSDKENVTYWRNLKGEYMLFQIDKNTGELSFIIPPDAEHPLDADLNNIYQVSIIVDDGINFAEKTIVVKVLDVNDNPPVIQSPDPLTVAENTPEATVIGTLSATDADITPTTFNWSIQTNADVNENGIAALAIDTQTGQLMVNDPADFNRELADNLSVMVSVSDGVNTSLTIEVTVNIADVNDEKPVIVGEQNFTIDENSAKGSTIGTLSFTDSDVTPTTNAKWMIVSNYQDAVAIDQSSGEITVNDPALFDREAIETISFTVTLSDGTNTSDPATIEVNLNDLNDVVPVVNSDQAFSLDENSPEGTVIGTLSFSDGDVTPTTPLWSIVNNVDVDGDGIGAVGIDQSSGEITVLDPDEFNYEQQVILTIAVQVSDGVNTSQSKQVLIRLNNLNDEVPVVDANLTFNIDENSPMGTVLGTLTATDADINTTFSDWTIVENYTGSNDVEGAVALDPSTGQLTVANSDLFDYETVTQFTIMVTVSDGTNTSQEQEVTVTLNNVDETGTGVSVESFSTKIRVYPNPAIDELTIEAPLGSQAVLYDVNGKQLKVLNIENSVNKLNVGDLRRGTYFLRIQNGSYSTMRNILLK